MRTRPASDARIAKQFFADALDRELIDRNPFGEMEGLTVGASERSAITLSLATKPTPC